MFASLIVENKKFNTENLKMLANTLQRHALKQDIKHGKHE